jgi:antitoxin component of RelBE/YafQ-DinJ toxin-antitoxin module
MAAKSEILAIRISPEVKAILAEKAAALGMAMSEYVRLLILEDARKTLNRQDGGQ